LYLLKLAMEILDNMKWFGYEKHLLDRHHLTDSVTQLKASNIHRAISFQLI